LHHRNTIVVVVAGSGPEAVTVPAMAAFARALGFAFSAAHHLGHSDRKGRIERPFSWVERKLPGRTFIRRLRRFEPPGTHLVPGGRQPETQTRTQPEAAYVLEKPDLQPLRVLLPVYEVLERVVDLYDYVSVDTNRYSIPERLVGQAVSVHKHPSEIIIYHRGGEIARHPRLIGQRDARHTLPGHHPTPLRADRAPRA
jgi:hypothetical protein